MKILLVGARGTIGKAVAAELGKRHQILAAGRSGPDLVLDLADRDSIAAALDKAGRDDAIVSAAGEVGWGPLLELRPEEWALGVSSKLMGQVNLALLGQGHLEDGGSITLVTGVLTTDPVPAGAVASLANGGVEAFVRAAAIQLPRGIRINAVSPGVLAESAAMLEADFPGFEPVAGARVAMAYRRSVEGADTGKVCGVR